ncbi:FAD-dependent monooxygenase [Aquimarina sp. 2201CG1-2-11]|uniref:FAD-dependent monooxygenase n=1 Tax=Aquimarina discodermiae TaxID=3231043 RepID=UPI003462C470
MKYSIIGAGIGGLTTGLAFEKKGVDYQIFERFSELNEVGAGIWLSPNALQILEYLGVLDEIKEKGNLIKRITIGKPDLSPISDSPQDAIIEKFGYASIAIHRAELQKILLDKIPTGKIYLGKGFDSYKHLNNGRINVHFGDGSATETEYLIGADGINSKVRKQLFPNSQLRYSGQTCWRGVAHIELDKSFDHRVYELWGNQIRFGFSRISKGKFYWFAVVLDNPNQKDRKGEIQQKLLTMFSDFHSVVKELIQATPEDKIIRNDINDLKTLSKWYKNNTCLIGDAGHATTPNMGQGGAQAIEDAYYLSHLHQGVTHQNSFESFQKKRQPKVNSIVKQSWVTGKMAHWKYGTGLRNQLLKNVPKKIVLKKMIEMYEIEKFTG